MKKRKNTLPLVLHGLLLIVVYVFQGMIFPYLRLAGLVPLLLPIVSTGAAVYQGSTVGGISGLFAGMLCDLSFNEPVGVFMVVLTFAGIAVGALTETLMTKGFGTYIICCTAVLALSAFVQLFPLLFYAGVPPAPLLTTAIWQTVYSLLFVFPIWFFVRSPSTLGRAAGRRQ